MIALWIGCFCARHVAVLVAQVMGFAQPHGQLFVILPSSRTFTHGDCTRY